MTIIISKDNSFLDLLRTNLKKYYDSHKRKPDDKIHVSDVLFGSCLRKAYYARISERSEFTNEDIDNFVRGESSEHILVDLADIGVSQQELLFEDDLIARPDLMSNYSPNIDNNNNNNDEGSTKKESAQIIVEFKDTKSFDRLTPDNPRFKSYLRQLLYYLIISGYDTGILCIRYALNRNLQWIKRDSKGDYFFSPRISSTEGNNKLPDLETWTVILEKGSPLRDLLKNEIRMRVSMLRSALISKSDLSLPKVAEEWKCTRCPFIKKCNPKEVTKQDTKVDILDEEGRIITIIPN